MHTLVWCVLAVVVMLAAVVLVAGQGSGAAATTPTPTGDRHILWGDVDCDDGISSRDALGVLVFVAALPAIRQEEPCPDIGTASREGVPPHGDVFCDGAVDSVDALGVLRFVANLSNPYVPNCPPIGASVGE